MAPSPSRIAGDPKDAFIEPPAIRRQRLVNAMAKQKEQLWQNNNPGIPPIPKTRPSHADISKEIVQTINWIHRHFNHPNPFAVSPEAETNKVHDDNAKEYDRLIRDIQVQQFNLGLLVLGDSPQSFFAQSMSTLACIKHCQLALGQTTFQDTPCVFQYPGLGQYGNFEPTDDNLEELRHAVHWFKRAEVYMEPCAAVFRVIWFESSQKVDTAVRIDWVEGLGLID
ncbi:uncharacterized protein N7529_000692 [Penicillium soppii]|uniref:uncharacterized protein n=1 Tax=Penicillium soppii TaxID=69789 RepID=UPI002546C049|nr:uncharacterized protein N7529_000692 [Penicillium soppii]KAJ5882020.1 hypothetical protein N7529_000692 [Penicillium soppii]